MVEDRGSTLKSLGNVRDRGVVAGVVRHLSGTSTEGHGVRTTDRAAPHVEGH